MYRTYVGTCMRDCRDDRNKKMLDSIGTRTHQLGSVSRACIPGPKPSIGLAVSMAQRVAAQVERAVLRLKPEWVRHQVRGPHNDSSALHQSFGICESPG